MPTDEQWDRAKALLAEGRTPAYVARATGISRQLLWYRFSSKGEAARLRRCVANRTPDQIERDRAQKRRAAEAIRLGKRIGMLPTEIYQMLKPKG